MKNNHLIDFDSVSSFIDGQRIYLDYFADQVDYNIQNNLVSELMIRYADISKQLEEKNRILEKYSNHLEELVQEKVREISASQIATIHALVKSAESRDDDTGAHIERTAAYCKLIAEKLLAAGLYRNIIDEAYPQNIERAAPLHDIGKVGIEDAILLKPGRLTVDEFKIMKTHVSIGYETLASVAVLYTGNAFLELGMEISRYHHEKWDGSGYMNGLSREEIPLSARIMALSDVYDALRSKRVYKEAFSHDKSIEIINKGNGNHFDPKLVDIFNDNHLIFCKIFDTLSL
ncbi:MAG: HD domain-containing protein [Oscillospiraceae bacterium]|jgi:putative two-component system response regulator|nr:HD domain-containing protein [Oscillospiraceae bacterium]